MVQSLNLKILNQASFNGIAGVYARGWGSAVKVEGCTISNNSWQGATCAHGGYVEVHNSWVEKNGMAGVCAFGEGSRCVSTTIETIFGERD